MFKWLADMLVKTPVQGTCSCCEGKKQRLQKMQEAIERGEVDPESLSCNQDVMMNCDSIEHEYVGKVFGSLVSSNYPPIVHHQSNCNGDYCAKDKQD